MPPQLPEAEPWCGRAGLEGPPAGSALGAAVAEQAGPVSPVRAGPYPEVTDGVAQGVVAGP